VTPLRIPHGVLVVGAATFAVLALAIVLVGTVAADTVIRNHVLAAASPQVIAVMRVINMAGDWRFLLPATLLLFVVFDRARRTWWIWLTLMVAAPLAESVLKITVGRPRPEGAAYGFPSGHATAAAAYFGAVLYLSESLRPTTRRVVRSIAIALIVLVGIARIMLRAHWPSDVVGGFALGLALASAATVFASRRS
jgi:undecaprenyl-diphosphatase